MLFDSHAHLTCDAFDFDLEAVLKRAHDAGIESILNIATTPDELRKSFAISTREPKIYHAAATTPHDVLKEGELHFSEFASLARSGKLQAIGETGLDYHYEHSPRELQITFLRRYIALANACQLPLVIHCRDAFADLFTIMDMDAKHLPVVLHCFTGTLEEAKEVVARNWYLSLSGIVTFKKSEALRAVANWVPLENLLIETDAPFLAPNSRRGKRNEPAYVVETAEFIANLRGISLQELALSITRNSKNFIGISS